MTKTRAIWVVNHSGHNYTSAIQAYKPSEVHCLTEGNVRVDEIDRIKYNMAKMLKEHKFSYKTDMVLLCGNITLNTVISAVLFGYLKVPYVDLLIWDNKGRHYLLRNLNMEGIDVPTVFNDVPRETP